HRHATARRHDRGRPRGRRVHRVHRPPAARRPGGARERGQAGMNGPDRIVTVWDIPIRLFHWLVAVLVAAAYATWRFNWMEWHSRVGSLLLALLIFRLVWGVFGSDTARFS